MKRLVCLLVGMLIFAPCGFAAGVDDFVGRWALDLRGSAAGWLKVVQEDNYLDASVLWGGGSVLPVDFVTIDGDTLYVTRTVKIERKDDAGKVVRTQTATDVLELKVDGDAMEGKRISPRRSGRGYSEETFTGKRIPAVPPAPDLSKVKFGKPIALFNGKDLSGWRLTNEHQANGWSVVDGVLVNNPVQKEGRHRSYGNLRTDREFEDFNLTLDVNVPKGGNSGIYLRGIYEVQVADTYGKPLDPHNMGGIYSRITPSVAAEKPAGEWQHCDITLVDRHVTVKLNGKTIIDNAPLEGCTGGALTADEFKPGPLYLQGDHTGVSYRNMVLRPAE